MKKTVKKKKSWFMNMLSGTNGDVSSKRFFGGVGIAIMHAIAILSVILFPESHWIGELLITLTITDAGLLGVGVFEKERRSTMMMRLRKEGIKETPPETEEDELDETEG